MCTVKELLAYMASGCVGLLCLAAPLTAQPTVGVTESEITIGSCSAQSGPSQKLGQQMFLGASTYVDTVNMSGGVHGRKIRLIKEDDGYDPAKAEECFKRLQSQKVFADAFFVGTPTAKKYVPLAEENKVPLVGLFTGAPLIYEPLHHYVFNVRASYLDETREQVDGLWGLGMKRVAVIRADDAFGDAVLLGVQTALKRYSAETAAVASFPRETGNVEPAVTAVKAANPDAVILVGSYAPVADIIRRAHQSNWRPLFLTVSFVGTDEFIEEAKSDAEGIVITQVVPPWNLSAFYRTVGIYRGEMAKKNLPPGYVSLEGFVDAMVVVEALKRAGKDLTREKFIHALESMHGGIEGMDLGPGLKINFSPTSHKGFQGVFMTVVRGGSPVPVTDWSQVAKK